MWSCVDCEFVCTSERWFYWRLHKQATVHGARLGNGYALEVWREAITDINTYLEYSPHEGNQFTRVVLGHATNIFTMRL